MIILCDIDGVVADCTHRLKYLENKDYDKFYSADEILNDKPIELGIDLITMLADSYLCELYYVTGRPYRTEEATKAWFKRHGVPIAPMIMRHDHDFRKSEIVKAETLEKFLANTEVEPNSMIFIDDDPLNVAGVCRKHPQIKGLTFGAERLDRIIELSDRYKGLL